MTTLYLRLPVVVDDADPMRCGGQACPMWTGGARGYCHFDVARFARSVNTTARHPDCVEATNAAIDAEIEALQEGHDSYSEWDIHAKAAFRRRIDALEARKVKP